MTNIPPFVRADSKTPSEPPFNIVKYIDEQREEQLKEYNRAYKVLENQLFLAISAKRKICSIFIPKKALNFEITNLQGGALKNFLFELEIKGYPYDIVDKHEQINIYYTNNDNWDRYWKELEIQLF